MKNFNHQKVEAKEEEKKGVAVKETSKLETNVQLEILGTIDKDKDSLDTFCSLKTRQNTSQTTSSALKSGIIASLKGGDDKVQKSRSSEKPDIAGSNKYRERNKHSLKSLPIEEITPKAAVSSLQEGSNNPEVYDSFRIEQSKTCKSLLSKRDEIPEISDSLKIEQKKFESEGDSQEFKRNSIPLEQMLILDSGESNKDGESKKRGLTSTDSFKDGDSKKSSKKLKTEENTSENVTKKKCRPSLNRRLRRKGLSCRKNTLIKKSGPSEKSDGADVSSSQEVNMNPEAYDSCRMNQTETKGVALLSKRDNTPQTSDSLEIEQKKFEAEQVFQEPKHKFSPFEDRLNLDAVSSNKDGESKQLGIFTESFEDECSKESFKGLKTQENASVDVTERKCRPSLRRRLQEKGLSLKLLENKPISEVDKILKFGPLEIPDVAESNKNRECKQQTEEITLKHAVSSLQEGNCDPPVSELCTIENTNLKGVALSSKKDSALETSDSLEIGPKKNKTEEVFQDLTCNFSPLEDRLKPVVVEPNKDGESKKLGLISTESFEDEDGKESSKKLKAQKIASEDVTKRKGRPCLRRRLREKRLVLKLLENKPLSGADEIQEFGSLEIPDVAVSNKKEECKQQTKKIAPKPAVSSLQEGNGDPPVSESCTMENTNSKGIAFSSKTDSTSETSNSLKIGQKKIETEEVFQELTHNFTPLEDRLKPDAVEPNKDEESKKLGLISTESFEGEDGKESSKKLKAQKIASEDVTKRKGRPCLRRRLREKRLVLKLLENKPLSGADEIQEFGPLEIPDVAVSNKNGECKQQTEKITPKPAVSSVQKGNSNPLVSESCKIEKTNSEGVAFSLEIDSTPETSDLLKIEQKKIETKEVFQQLKHNFTSLEDRLKPNAVEANKDGESKKLGLISTESFECEDSKQSSKELKTQENASEDFTKRKGRPSQRRRQRKKRLALKLLANVPLNGVDEIQKVVSLEIPDVAESNKNGECKKQTEEITPKPAVSSLQEGKNNPPVSNSCKIKQTGSKGVALSLKRDSTLETSDSLEIGQKKIEAKEVFQEEVKNNSENADPSVTEENSSGIYESLKVYNISLEDSSIVMKKSETVEIPLTVAASLTEKGVLKSTYIEKQPKVSESSEATCETSKNNSSLGTTGVKNESGTVQESTVKRKKRKKKKKKKKPKEGVVDSQPGNQRAQAQKQENLYKKKENEKKVKPQSAQTKKSKMPNQFLTSPQFSFANIWHYAGSRSNTPVYQESLHGYPPALPLMPRNLAGNPRHFLYHQSLLGSLGLASLIQGNLSGNQVTPSINQESFLGNRGVSPMMQLNLPANLGHLSNNQMIASPTQANRPSYQGNPLSDPGNLSRYYENLGDQPRNHSMIWNEVNPSSNEVKSEKPDRSQGMIGRQSRWEPPGNLPGSQDTKERLSKWEPIGNLPGSQDSKGRLSRWESIGNLPESQEYPSRYQDDLLAQPSTSRSEVQSGDSYYSGECSLGSRKRRRSRDSHSPDDCKRSRSSESESTSRNNNLFKLIISKDFGKLRLGQEELMLIRIAISQEIDKIPKGHIPKFNDTFLKVYGIIVDCADEWSRDWLADTITKISPWTGARLRLIDLPQTEKFYDAILFIPGVVEKAEIILGRLERQNPSLKTGIWKVYSVEEKCDQKGFNLKLGIPVPSLKALQDLNFKPFLGMTKVAITITKSVRILDLDKDC